jgi:hypothetical protein
LAVEGIGSVNPGVPQAAGSVGTFRRRDQGAQPHPVGVSVTVIARAFGGLAAADWALAGLVD